MVREEDETPIARILPAAVLPCAAATPALAQRALREAARDRFDPIPMTAPALEGNVTTWPVPTRCAPSR